MSFSLQNSITTPSWAKHHFLIASAILVRHNSTIPDQYQLLVLSLALHNLWAPKLIQLWNIVTYDTNARTLPNKNIQDTLFYPIFLLKSFILQLILKIRTIRRKSFKRSAVKTWSHSELSQGLWTHKDIRKVLILIWHNN